MAQMDVEAANHKKNSDPDRPAVGQGKQQQQAAGLLKITKQAFSGKNVPAIGRSQGMEEEDGQDGDATKSIQERNVMAP